LARRQRDDLMRLQLQKERLSQFIVHDLKNPVSSLDLCAQSLLRDHELPEQARVTVQRIRDDAHALLHMLLNLLDVSRSDERGLMPRQDVVQVQGLFEQVAHDLSLNAQAANVRLTHAREPLAVVGETDLLVRVLKNLVDNAIRHAREATEVHVSAKLTGSSVEIRVADQGPGIRPEVRETVFEPFVQLEQGASAVQGLGRGLGLNFCKIAIEAHGGRIWVEDAAPGAVFCFTLPHANQSSGQGPAFPTPPQAEPPESISTRDTEVNPEPTSPRGAALGRLLVVDDELNARTALAKMLREEGYEVETAQDGFKALPKLQEFAPDLLLTDLKMPGMDGLRLMEKAFESEPEPAAILMTASGTIDSAVAAMRAGAADYITKPINFDELLIIIERALERRLLSRETGQLRARVAARDRIDNIVGRSAPMLQVFEAIMQVAPSRASVLILGESGTGKELVASAIHQHSTRAGRPFIKLHCAALAESLLESELFGHERGAFTGALTRREGRFKQADGGTLFLDEIGEISPAIQVKLLRFLQEREFEPVGANHTVKVDVRIIAATNRNLAEEVKAGRFREDLFYRLNVVTIETPPLRARPSDIPLLALRFLHKFTAESGKAIRGFTDEALQQLTLYSWPGNVRELENAIERAVVVCRHHEIRQQDLPPDIVKTTGRAPDGMPIMPGATLAELEQYAILKTLEHTGGATTRAAEMLGVSPRTIQYRLREYAAK